MGRAHIDVPVPALALRRAQAAAALGVSVEMFDREIRGDLPTVRVGNVTTFPHSGLEDWIANHADRPASRRFPRRP